MPLVINGNVVEDVPRSVADFIQSYPHFKESAAKLCAQSKVTVGPSKLLYVGQREMASTRPADSVISVLGSEDSTTCHIVILRNTGSKATCLAHLDGCRTEDAVQNMVKLVQKLSPENNEDRLELYIAGGFTDERGSSEELSVSILGSFHHQPEEIHLMMACITDLNTVKRKGVCWPVIYGIGIDVTSGEIFPATFPGKGPDQALRSARHFSGGDEVLNIYDPETHRLIIGPFHYDTMDRVDRWCQAPDSFLRKYLSTSPAQEPEGFEASVRQALIQIRDCPNPLKTVFKKGKPRTYKKEENGSWALI